MLLVHAAVEMDECSLSVSLANAVNGPPSWRENAKAVGKT